MCILVIQTLRTPDSTLEASTNLQPDSWSEISAAFFTWKISIRNVFLARLLKKRELLSWPWRHGRPVKVFCSAQLFFCFFSVFYQSSVCRTRCSCFEGLLTLAMESINLNLFVPKTNWICFHFVAS